MVMKEAWLQLVLNHLKTIEIRNAPAPLGKTWLGCDGQVHGAATIVSCTLLTEAEYKATRSEHRHLGEMPRYRKTYALALQDVTPLTTCVDYYRQPATQPWTVFRTGPGTRATRSTRCKKALEPVQDMPSEDAGPELGTSNRAGPLPLAYSIDDTKEPPADRDGA